MKRQELLAFAYLLVIFSVKGETCGKPGKPLNGDFQPTKEGYELDEKVEYHCNNIDDYLNGDVKRTCLNNNTWSGSVPDCSTRVEINETNISGNNSLCNLTSLLDNDTKTFCTVWSQNMFEIDLKHTELSEIHFIINTSGANYTNTTNIATRRGKNLINYVYHNDTLKFVCTNCNETPVKISFHDSLNIYEIRAYSNEKKVCGTPDVPFRGNFEKIVWNDFGHFSCEEGYSPRNVVHKCSKGQWGKIEKKCAVTQKKKIWDTCGEPGSPSNGTFEIKNPHHQLIYVCDKGFVLVGDKERVCLANGTWSAPIPKCVKNVALDKKAFHRPTGLPNTFSTDGNYTTCENQTKHYKAYIDMEKSDTSFDFIQVDLESEAPIHLYLYVTNKTEFKEKRDFKWSSVEEICYSLSRNTLPKLPTLCNFPKKAAKYLLIWLQNNASIYEITVYDSAEITPCGSPDQPLNGKISNRSSDEAFYECDDGFILNGSQSVQCRNGVWESKIIARCDPDKKITPQTTSSNELHPQTEKNKHLIKRNIGIAVAVIVLSVALITSLWFFKKFRVKNNALDVQALNKNNNAQETEPKVEINETEDQSSLYENLDSLDYKKLIKSEKNIASVATKNANDVPLTKLNKKTDSVYEENDLYEAFYNNT